MRVPPGIVFDCEGDGLHPTKFWCLVAKDEEGEYPTTDYADYRAMFLNSSIIVGHNIRRWDLVHLNRVVSIDYSSCRVVDTLALSWYLYPSRNKHGLESWGEDFGIPKPEIEDWNNLTVEEYLHRCTEDVKINWKLWTQQWNFLWKLYEGNEEKIWEFLDYLDFKMFCAMKQEESKWKLDTDLATQTIEKLEYEREVKTRELEAAMPKVPITVTRSYPAKPLKKDGTLSNHGLKWKSLLEERQLPSNYKENIEVITGYDEPNAGSHQQIKDWLFSLGWIPQTYKETRNKKTGETKEVPQINLEHGKGICESVKKLFKKEPRLEALDGLSVISHRLSLVRGFLENMDSDGFVRAEVQGLTNTLRFKHAVVVNLPKVGKPWGEEIRGCLVARKNKVLVGADQSSLEDRLKQHFAYPYDPDYVKRVNIPGFDPHLRIAVLGEMITDDQAEAYKNGDKTHKSVRDIAKNVNYSGQYGAGPPKMAKTGGFSLAVAKKLHEAYWKENWFIKAIAKDQTYKTVDNEMWLLNPLNGFWYSLRSPKDIVSTLIQGSASYVFDLWLGFVLQEREQVTAQFHDEFVLECDDDEKEIEKVSALIIQANEDTNIYLKLNRELGTEVQTGYKYSEIH